MCAGRGLRFNPPWTFLAGIPCIKFTSIHVFATTRFSIRGIRGKRRRCGSRSGYELAARPRMWHASPPTTQYEVSGNIMSASVAGGEGVSNRPTSGSGFTREFIADSSLLARYLGGVGLYLLSSSFSFPELLVGSPMSHPLLLPLFTRVRRRGILRSSAEQGVIGQSQGAPAEDQPRRVDLRREEHDERCECDERRDRLDQRSSAELPRHSRHERQRGHVSPVQEARQYRGIAQAGDDGPGEGNEDEAWKEDPDGSEDGSRDPGEDVSDKSRRGEDRPRRDLPDGHGVKQLLVSQEPGIDELGPQEGQEHVTAAEEYRSDLQERHEDAQRPSEGGGGRE